MRRLAILAALGALVLPVTAAGQQADLEARYRAGAAAFGSGRPLDALELLEPVVAAAPAYADAQLLLGQACLVAGLERQAKRHFEQILARQPDNGQVTFLLGFSLYRSSRWFEAVEALDRAHALARGNPYPRLYRGLSRLKLGDPTAARADIQAALRIAPDDDAVRVAAAELDLAEGRFQAAEQRLRPLAERTGDVEQLILLARSLLEQGRGADAVEVLAPVDSMRSDLLYVRAQALLRSGDGERGKVELERFRQRKKLEERLRLLEATVSTDPGDVEARLELTGLLIDDGRTGGARLHLSALRRLLPGDRRVAALAGRLERLDP